MQTVKKDKKRGSEAMQNFDYHFDQEQMSSISDGRLEEGDFSEKVFSFNQSFTNNIEQNQKIIQERQSSLSKIKSLEEEIRHHKNRSNLWEKSKNQILNLSKLMKLSSVELKCSDSAIMKQFFEQITKLLNDKNGKSSEETFKVQQFKRKQKELFEKLVDSQKKVYQLQQKIVQRQNEVARLQQINQSLRQKSRAISTERSSKIRQFHEETLVTIHHKDLQLTALEDKNLELKKVIEELQNKVKELNQSLNQRQEQFIKISHQKESYQLKISEKNNYIEELKAEKQILDKTNKKLNLQIQQLNQQQKQVNENMQIFKQEFLTLSEQNVSIRKQLTKRKETILNLKTIIEEAKKTNDRYIEQIEQIKKEEQLKRQIDLHRLIEKEDQKRKSIKSLQKIDKSQSKKLILPTRRILDVKSFEIHIPSQEMLL